MRILVILFALYVPLFVFSRLYFGGSPCLEWLRRWHRDRCMDALARDVKMIERGIDPRTKKRYDR